MAAGAAALAAAAARRLEAVQALAAEMKARLLLCSDARRCLFAEEAPGCEADRQAKKMAVTLQRMKHNFTILDIECLINLKGLLAYIAERI